MRLAGCPRVGVGDGSGLVGGGASVKSELHALAILDVLRAGVLAVTRDGMVTRANPKAAKIMRRSEADFVGKPIAEILAPLPDLLAVGQERGELTVERADGTPVGVGFSLSTMPDGGQHVILFREITSVLELRKQRDRLLQAAGLVGVMPTLLHDIRNPLAAVVAMLELLAEEASPPLSQELHAVLGQVHRITLSLQGIAGLVETMHAPTTCAVDRTVREACLLLAPLATQRGVTLRAIGPDLPPLPVGSGAVSGVVFNLVKNAIEASIEGGRVDVEASLAGDELSLVVEDDGAGMTPETLARCRELFFTTKTSGSGVGLALCQRVADASGGRLEISSHLGLGTRVVLRVPLAPGHEQLSARTSSNNEREAKSCHASTT